MDLDGLINGDVAASDSVVLRYADVLKALQLEVAQAATHFAACSQREGIEAVALAPYRDVEITLVDESSGMQTGTYKDLDACVISSVLRRAGVRRVVVSSGGNLASALASYSRKNEFEVISFIPHTTLAKLEGAHFDHDGATVIAAGVHEKKLKALASNFARRHGILEVPDVRWRLAASSFRAMFLLEEVLDDDRPSWIAQTMCAGYGPTGIYNCFSELEREGLMTRTAPRFLGFQQEANSPMVRAWRGGRREVSRDHVRDNPDEYLEPVLYNTNPGRNYTRLYDLVKHYGGTLESIGAADFDKYAGEISTRLGACGRALTRHPQTHEYVERTGLLTGIGILKAIDKGIVGPGERVIYLLTGGIRRECTSARVNPRVTVDDSWPEDEWITRLGHELGIPPFSYRRASDYLFDGPSDPTQ